MPLAAGSAAPPAAVRDLAGAPVELSALASRGPALLFFFKADCPASPLGARTLPRFGAVTGLAVAAISQDAPDEARAFGAAAGLEAAGVALLLDPEPWPASDAYGVLATPTWILLAPGGRVEAVREGWSRDDANALAAHAAALARVPAPIVSATDDPGPPFRPG